MVSLPKPIRGGSTRTTQRPPKRRTSERLAGPAENRGVKAVRRVVHDVLSECQTERGRQRQPRRFRLGGSSETSELVTPHERVPEPRTLLPIAPLAFHQCPDRLAAHLAPVEGCVAALGAHLLHIDDPFPLWIDERHIGGLSDLQVSAGHAE